MSSARLPGIWQGRNAFKADLWHKACYLLSISMGV